MMIKQGPGNCLEGYVRGWDNLGITSIEACNTLCLVEVDCMFVSFLKGKTCSRYNAVKCTLTTKPAIAAQHITFAKVAKSKYFVAIEFMA